MRVTEKAVAIIILALITWAVIMSAATNFVGNESSRILRVELGSDAASLKQAVAANGRNDRDGIAHNVQMVLRNTYMDYVFILLYWLTFVGLAVLAARLGGRFFAACAIVLISFAALCDLLENYSILIAMHVSSITDAVAVDISEYSQFKWAFFYLAALLLGLAIALNHRVSTMRRVTGWLFVASSVFGLLGIARYRVSLDFTIWMFRFGMLFVAAALALTLWKIYLSLKELNQLEKLEQVHA